MMTHHKDPTKKQILKAVQASNEKQKEVLDRYDKEFPDGPKKFYKGKTWHDEVSMISPEEEPTNKNEEWKKEVRILMANFAMYLSNDRGPEFDNHEAEIKKFEAFISKVRASAIREFAERLKVNFAKELHCTPHLDLTIPFKKAIELSQIEEEGERK